MGEQSNAYRILLRYDRKSRHRRIKKQRRYERLAATSQFRYTDRPPLHGGWPGHFSVLCGPVDGRALSGGRSPYLRYPQGVGTHTLASVELPSFVFREPGQLRIVSILRVVTRLPQSRLRRGGVASHALVPETWRDIPASRSVALSPAQHNRGEGWTSLDWAQRLGLSKLQSLWYISSTDPHGSDSRLRAKLKPSSLNGISAGTDYILGPLKGPLPFSRWTASPQGLGCG